MHRFLISLLYLCRKELLAILKDPASRTVLLLPILVETLLFGYAATYDLDRAPYGLLDQSHSKASADFIARLEGGGTFRRVANLESQRDIARLVDGQEALLILQIGPEFEQQLIAGKAAPIQVILDARNSNTAATAARYVGSVVEAFNNDWRRRHGGTYATVMIDSRAWFNPNLETRWNLLPGLVATLSMLQTLMLTALSIAREREQGTFDQLLVTPLTPTEIMIGKTIPPILIGLTQSALVLLIVLFWFNVPMAGSLATLYAGLLLFIVACVGIGLSISALSANMQQAMFYTFVILMPMVLLSGLTTPILNMPEFMQTLTLLNPLRHGVDFVRRVYLEGAGIRDVLNDIWPLTVMAAVTLPSAAWLCRNRLV